MKFKKICYSTQLSDLYGRDGYQSHIEVGREYWCYFSREPGVDEGWHKIKITYTRSGCAFYIITDKPDIPERFFAVNCFMAATLVFADIDPAKDLKDFGNDNERKLYCFDTEHTVVHNWPNEKEIELDENDPLFSAAYILCKEIKD